MIVETIQDKVILASILLILVLITLVFIKNSLDKKYNVKGLKEPLLSKVNEQIKWLVISFFIYGVGFIVAFIGYGTIGFFIAPIGISLSIFYTQTLESLQTEYVIEKKLGSKIEKLKVTQLQRSIAEESAKRLIEEINIDELKNEIKVELIKNLKGK